MTLGICYKGFSLKEELFFMEKYVRLGFTAIALTFVFSAFAVIEANAQINDILKRMDEHYKALKSLKADVSREQVNSQIGSNDKYSGTISLVPGKKSAFSMRLDWISPRNEIISVVNGKYVVYNPRTNQAYTGDSGSKTLNEKGGNALKVMSMSKEEIKANYNVQYLGEESLGNAPTWHLKLTPKVKSNYKFVDLWVDGNGMPIRAKITQLNDDTDQMTLTNLKKNASIKGAIFKVNLPKGTQIVKG
jgi:outer membrane lipoprotein-sorting protein